MPNLRPRIAIATGDPAGIGPEISLKAARDASVTAICRPIVVGDLDIIRQHASAARIGAPLRAIADVSAATWDDGYVNVLNAPADTAGFSFGRGSAACGLAALASARRAVQAALARTVEAVVAAPQNETSIAAAGITFDGYPGFVARETGLADEDVFLMLCFGDRRIVHVTLHVGVSRALQMITRERVARTIRTADATLRTIGIAAPKILVGGLNPHAGEGGLFGREEIEIIAPAIEEVRREGRDVDGPFGADTMFHKAADAFVVMLHDQGHITAKVLAPNRIAAMTIGTPILFSSVAHGSAYDIAGKGIADPAAMVEAIHRLAAVPVAA